MGQRIIYWWKHLNRNFTINIFFKILLSLVLHKIILKQDLLSSADTTFVGLLLDKTISAKAPLTYGEFAGGKFAVFQLAHTAQAVADWYRELDKLIQHYQLTPRPAPIIERYQDKLIKVDLCEMLLPIY